MALRTRTRRGTAAGVVMGITAVVVGIIVLGIILVVAGANRGNMLVDFFLDIGTWLTTPFHSLFPRYDAEQSVLINWGIAALVYFVIGSVIARFSRG